MHPNVHWSTSNNSQNMETIYMFINRGIDKEYVIHIYNWILPSHKKEWNWAICRDVDGPRVCYTEWSKSEREKQMLHINAYVWNLEKCYRQSHLKNRDTDVRKKNIKSHSFHKPCLCQLIQWRGFTMCHTLNFIFALQDHLWRRSFSNRCECHT